jgi:hypothetical protein
MTRTWVAFLLLMFSTSCALIQSPPAVTGPASWPSNAVFVEGEGDLSFSSQKERFSGTFLLSLVYPSSFFLEVYGGFGQTLIHVERNKEKFLFIAGDEKTTDEHALSARFGLSAEQLMDDLCKRGPIETDKAGFVIHRPGYEVVFSQTRRGKHSVCWEKQDGRICLVFDKVLFEEP